MSSGFEILDLHLGYGGRKVIRGLSLHLPERQFTAILGPNGCGKSTLLRALVRLVPPDTGAITLDGADLRGLSLRALARRVALLPQMPLAPDGITVADLIARGRAPWRGLLSSWTPADEAARAAAIAATGLEDLAERAVADLSGGQRQRVWIALTLAQDTPYLLLDEPTTWLDLPHQIEMLSLLGRLQRQRGRTVVAVLHDLNLAARYADHLVLLAPGQLVAAGPPAAVLTEANIRDAFGMTARILPDPITATPMVVPEAPSNP